MAQTTTRALLRTRLRAWAWWGICLAVFWAVGAHVSAQPRVTTPSNTRANMSKALELFRNGEYEMAAFYYDQAQSGMQSLTNEERNDLTKLIKQNNVARNLRQEGQSQIKQAAKAIEDKRFAFAQQFLTKLATNQYLSNEDREAVSKLQDELRTVAPQMAPPAKPGEAKHTAKKWFQPFQMVKGFFKRDEGDSTPPEMPTVPADEPDPKAEAENPSNPFGAVKHIISWPTRVFAGDDAKETKIEKKAKKQPKKQPKTRPPTPEEIAAMKLIQKGYGALAKNDLETAHKMAIAAKESGVKLGWWEHNPEKLLQDIERRKGAGKSAAPKDAMAKKAEKKLTPEEARSHLAKGRTLLAEGKLDEADRIAALAGSVPDMRWGLFGDNPDKLQRDIRSARTRNDQQRAAKLLAEARHLFAKGKLKEAKVKAYEAEKLHGPHSIWDFGDRPSRLLAEIARAEKLQKPRPPLPPLPVTPKTQIAKTNPDSVPQPPTPPVPPTPAQVAKHPNPPDFEKPVGPQSTGGLAAKQRAVALLAEARQLQSQGKLIEARQKVKEAERLNAPFGPNENDPRSVLVGLAAQCDRDVKKLLQQATHRVTNMQHDPKRFQTAAHELAYARQLAAAFGQDPKRVDDKIAWLLNIGGGASNVGQLVNVQKQSQPNDPKTRDAWEKLSKARLELRAGNTAGAMHLAREAFNVLPNEATKMIRSIEAEEHNQRILEANRTANAAMEAFKHGQYAQAKRILDQLDIRLLSDDMKRWVREIGASPKLYEGNMVAGGMKPVNPGNSGEKPGQATISDLKPVEDNSLTAKVRALEDVQFQKLRAEGLAVQRKAIDYVQAKNIDDAVRVLKMYLGELNHVKLDDTRMALLKRPVESRLQQYQTIQARVSMTTAQNTIGKGHSESARQSAIHKQQQEVAALMKKYGNLYNAGRYKEAKQTAMMALEIDHKNRAARAALTQSTIAVNQKMYDDAKRANEEWFTDSLDLNRGPYADVKNPVVFDPDYANRVGKRKGMEALFNYQQNAIEKSIERKLTEPVTLAFKNTPLEQVLTDLHKISGVNVVPDTKAFEDAGVRMNLPMTITVEDISLKSALTLLLQKADLTYVVKNEVLMITTRDGAKGKLKRVTYPVADLVIPVDNKPLPDIYSLQKALERHVSSQSSPALPGGPMPFTAPFSLGQGRTISEYSSGVDGARPNMPGAMPFASRNASGRTLEEVLIELITQSVEPDSWNNMGGAGSIQYYPLGMALVINQTQDVQEQVLELLKALRRLQDLEVAIEMRLVSVSESFFERIGVDFDFTLLTNNKRYESQLLTGQFQPAGFINQFRPDGFVSGLTPAGSFTPDLNIPINNSSFNFSAPPFGGFPGTLGQSGGLALGLAFLSDIQVYMFLEAAQGDRRTNVMQAPKITVFNGQTANISVQDQMFFLTGVQLFQTSFGNIFFNPQNQPFPLGVNLQVTPVVSADRRFVRMNLTPVMTNLASATVPLIPITIPVPTVLQGPGAGTTDGPPENLFQMFFQQPTFTTIQVSTTVNVPDGGTVLLGGLKTLSEARNEFGPPILSKIPYLSRLFRNIGYGREAQSLMIMVTPRIIINEEEEQIFLGEIEGIPRT